MKTAAIRALVHNDLRLYLTDRRAIIVGIAVPILIAAFFGYVFGTTGDAGATAKIPVGIVDEDASVVSRAIAADLTKEAMIEPKSLTRRAAEELVRSGKLQVAAVIPQGFAMNATRALLTNDAKPEVTLLIDPSQTMSGRIVEGLFAQHAMEEITKAAFNGSAGGAGLADVIDRLDHATNVSGQDRGDLKALLEAAQRLNSRDPSAASGQSGALQRGLTIPYGVRSMPITSGAVPYNAYAHSFAGMTTQFLLFGGIDAGIVLLLSRERGIWQRLRSAPLSKSEFLLARAVATTLIGLFQFTAIYLFAIMVFGVRITGSVAGFAVLALLLCMLNAAFGLMLASIGRSAGATRGIAMMVTLLLVMVGGAWVPAFVFPKWLQSASLAAPTRWAVDGLDAVTWRGSHFEAILVPGAVLALTTAVCLTITIWAFRWDD